MKLSVVFALLLVSWGCFCDGQRLTELGEPYVYPSLDSIGCPGKTTPLYFGLIQSFDADQFDGSGAIAGVNVALDRINRNCSLLPGYSLHYTVADSKVSWDRLVVEGAPVKAAMVVCFSLNSKIL